MNAWRIAIGFLLLMSLWAMLFWASSRLCGGMSSAGKNTCYTLAGLAAMISLMVYGAVEYMFAFKAGPGYSLTNGRRDEGQEEEEGGFGGGGLYATGGRASY